MIGTLDIINSGKVYICQWHTQINTEVWGIQSPKRILTLNEMKCVTIKDLDMYPTTI